MSKSRLAALLRKNLGMESERPADAAETTETPAAVEETRAEETAPVIAEVPAAETPAVESEEAPAEAAVEVPAEPVAEEPAAAPAEEVPAAAEGEAERPAEEAPVVAVEGEGEEVIPQTPAEETAQALAEQAAEQAADAQAGETPVVADGSAATADVTEPVAAVAVEDEAAAPAAAEEAPAADAPVESAEPAAETPVEQAAEQVEQVEAAAAEVVAESTEAPTAAAEEPAPAAEVVEEAAPAETSTEDEAPAEVVAEEVPAVAAPVEDDSAHTFVGVIEADHDIDDRVQALESFEEIAKGLTDIAVSLEAAIQEGGLQPQAAMMLDHAVRAHTARLQITQPVTASLENYGGMSARVQATKISMEGVEEVAKQVIETIKKLAQELWAAMVEFVKKLFTTAKWVKEQAEKLSERQKAAKGQPKSNELTIKAPTAARLAIDGKLNGKLSKALHDIVTVAFDTVEYDKGGLKAIEVEREALMKALAEGKGGEAAKIFAENDAVLPRTFSHADGDTHSTAELAGGVKFTMVKHVVEAFGTPVTFYYATKDKSEATIAEDVQFRTPDLQEIGEILEVCKMIASVGDAVEGMGEALKAEADKVAQASKPNDIAEAYKVGTLVAAYRGRARELCRVSSMVMVHLVTTARAALQVTSEALDQYEAA